jgi:gluconokinase
MILYLYGLPGVGKNYIGKLIAKRFNIFFQDADEYLPSYMKDKLKKGEQFTINDVEYYHQIIADKVKLLSNIHNNFVICQASFFKKHRDIIYNTVSKDKIYFIYIKANKNNIIDRLNKRGGYVTPNYMNEMYKYLEISNNDFFIVNNINNQDDDIINQCEIIFRKIKIDNKI